MKKLALLSFGLMIALASCEEKEEEKKVETPSSQLILGTWDLDRIHYVEYEDGQKVGDYNEKDILKMTFTANNYLILEGSSDTTDYGSYQLTSDSLFLDGEAYKLNKLTKTELEFYLEDEYTYDSIAYKDEVTIYFEKN